MKRIVLMSCALVVFSLSIAVFAQENPAKPAEYTSVADVDKDPVVKRDFDIQGEYLGKVGDATFGQNLIARGGGKFDFVAFAGGLPGDGWKRGDVRVFGKGEFKDNGELEFNLEKIDDGKERRPITTDDAESLRGVFTIKDGKSTIVSDKKTYNFEKQYRESPTLGMKAPAGAVILFADGKPSDMFDKAQVNEDAGTLWSEASTKPFEKKPYSLHVEFLLSYMPDSKGQGRSNSGVYIDEAYECQVLDSFGLEGENNECGGFYTVAKPIVNMCFPPLRWQTYDIDFVPAKYDADGKKTDDAIISVKQNGVLIQDEIRPKKETPGRKKETPEARGLYLQGHGNKVQYKNIWLKYVD